MGSIGEERRIQVDTVCIIGAGPSGLAAAKYLLAEKAFSRIVVFEQRSKVGGLWNYVPCSPTEAQDFPVPQTNPHAGPDEPIRYHGDHAGAAESKGNAESEYMSPIYDRLETNIPRGLMGFSDLDWPEDCQLFPKHETVLEYIEQYAKDVKHLIQFETQVIDVSLREDERWSVKTKTLSSSRDDIQEQVFDAVLAANGHFNVPFVPDVSGIKEWNQTYPGSIIHSKFYRNPENYSGKKVIVVGNSASGVDIGAQVATTCKFPLLQSEKSESYFRSGAPGSGISQKPEITEYIVENRTVHFKDGSVETDVDAIIYCTGYFYSFPFLKSLQPSVVNSGEYVENTYKHIFYRPQPSLAFAVLNQKIIPFPVAEAQSAVIARVWSGRLRLPAAAKMEEWERETMKEAEDGKNFHVLKFPKDADYINEMRAWCADTECRSRPLKRDIANGMDGHELNGIGKVVGKEPPHWGEKEYWTRERFPAIKKAFQNFGDERHLKRTLESVGFDFQAWKQLGKEEGAT